MSDGDCKTQSLLEEEMVKLSDTDAKVSQSENNTEEVTNNKIEDEPSGDDDEDDDDDDFNSDDEDDDEDDGDSDFDDEEDGPSKLNLVPAVTDESKPSLKRKFAEER